jgi:NifU-like protein involved in Fe-S cluster formation
MRRRDLEHGYCEGAVASPVKIHCSVLAEDAIRAAIGDWKKKNSVAETQPRLQRTKGQAGQEQR